MSAYSTSGEIRIDCALDSVRLSFLWDHVVHGRSIMPGAAFFEMGACSSWELCQGEGGHALERLSIPAPLVLGSSSDCITLHAVLDSSAGSFVIQSRSGVSPSSRSVTHLRGHMCRIDASERSNASLSLSERFRGSLPVSVTSAYSGMASSGLEYRRAFQVLRDIHIASMSSSLPSDVRASGSACVDIEAVE